MATTYHQPILSVSTLDEAASKSLLRKNSIACPAGIVSNEPDKLADHADTLVAPLALKGLGTLHKSERGASLT